jgi:hypothetical protein
MSRTMHTTVLFMVLVGAGSAAAGSFRDSHRVRTDAAEGPGRGRGRRANHDRAPQDGCPAWARRSAVRGPASLHHPHGQERRLVADRTDARSVAVRNHRTGPRPARGRRADCLDAAAGNGPVGVVLLAAATGTSGAWRWRARQRGQAVDQTVDLVRPATAPRRPGARQLVELPLDAAALCAAGDLRAALASHDRPQDRDRRRGIAKWRGRLNRRRR